MSLFSYWSSRLNLIKFNGLNFSSAFGFAMFSPSNSYYYVSDMGLDKIFILNESWSYVSFKNFNNPGYFTTIGNSLYVTGKTNIWKLDENLNIFIQYNATGTAPDYRGIYFNCTNNLIYVAPKAFNFIHVFDLNLILIHNISTSPHFPYSIAEYNNQLFVGTIN
jgi:DNA-binding beta-propeller fold protein YncE